MAAALAAVLCVNELPLHGHLEFGILMEREAWRTHWLLFTLCFVHANCLYSTSLAQSQLIAQPLPPDQAGVPLA